MSKPEELQRQIDDLYSQAQQAMDRQAATPEPASQARYADRRSPRNNGGYNRPNGNGNGYCRTNGNRPSNGNGGGMTASQRRAIDAIARRLNIDAAQEARDVLGAELDQLSLRQASDFIDHLKTIQPSGNGH